MMSVPQSMFEQIEPRLTLWERLCERLKTDNSELKAARAKAQAAFAAYNSVGNRRDGTATIKRHKLVQCTTDQLRAENACK